MLSSLPDHTPFPSYRSGKSVRVVRYGRALRATKELIVKSGRNLDELALHSLRIFIAATVAAGGETSARVTQREDRWKSDAYKAYTRNNRGFERGVTWQGEGTRDSRGKEQPGLEILSSIQQQ